MVEERLCERAMCERVVCERVVCEIDVWHVWPKTVAPRQLRQTPCLPHRMEVNDFQMPRLTSNSRNDNGDNGTKRATRARPVP